MTTQIYTTDTDSGSISVIEVVGKGKHELRARISVGNAPRGSVKFTRDGRGFVSNCAGDTISELDAYTNRETTRIKVGVAPRGIGIVPGDRYLLVSNSGSDYVSVVDLSQRREIAQVATGRDPRHMAITPDGKAAYVAVWGSHYIGKIDTHVLEENRTDEIGDKVREVKRIHLGDGCHPYSVAISPGGKHLFVANTQSEKLTVIDIDKDAVHCEIDLGSKGARAVAFRPAGDLAMVSLEDTAELVAIDVASLEVVGRIPVGPGPRGIAFSPDGNTIYASAFARQGKNVKAAEKADIPFAPNTITVVDLSAITDAKSLSTGKVRWQEVGVGKGPCSVSVMSINKPSCD